MLCRLNFEFKAAMRLISRARPVVRFRDYWVDNDKERGQLALEVLKEFSNLSVLEVQGLFYAMDQSVGGGAPPPPGPSPGRCAGGQEQEQGISPAQAPSGNTRWNRSSKFNKVIATV